ncbi:insulinase family protein [Desulfonatronum sp. SC1]|uniref:insulinase family protein n=1 Tax=Desulfonatronum sp. SC1 TaxID=2109626 RepID=UPI000D31151F|nr:insulinase family protein [Desulfonatronum sp. SC1]PTN35962.1 peptidase M16 [Desulfonatronum sp. SC1]
MSHDFTLLKETFITELQARAFLYRHDRTGARLLSLVNDDENKVFGISFRTPPADSTGVAHILEHSVLCGSRKYPVKEPFVELLKGSLQTFLNAFTYPDKTCYPVASQNIKDFYNLIDVYLDAVFHPRLTPEVFGQEGWHYEMDANGTLSIQGVVYNEMKGAYASPDGLLSEYSQQSLFPDTTYGLDSGGNPERIPKLTFDQFLDFHERYYHPSNAFIYFSGDDDPEQRLALVSEALREFDRLEVDSHVQSQAPFASPTRQTRGYPVSAGEKNAGQAMLTLNWVVGDALDVRDALAWQILEYLLVEMPSSPLRKALIDSSLGDDLAGVGLEAELRQLYFSTGLRGMRVEAADRVESLIRETLERLVRDGVPTDLIEAALNSVEFRLRERNSGRFPRGLAVMLQALILWLHDADPLEGLAFEEDLKRLKKDLLSGKRVFETMIQARLLDNPHHGIVLLAPDPELGEKMRRDEEARLAEARTDLDGEGLEAVRRRTEKLKAWQETPDSPENLATIPGLTRADLDRSGKHIPRTVLDGDGCRVLFHDQFTTRIVHMELGLDLRRLPLEDLPYAALLGKVLVEIGTEKEDYAALATRISRKTGGIWPELFTSSIRDADDDDPAAWLFLRGKAMDHGVDELLAIFTDLLLAPALDDRRRFTQLLLEEKAGFERMLIPRGHTLVNTRLRAGFSLADLAGERMNGISYLFFLRELIQEVENNWERVQDQMRSVLVRLLDRASMVVNVTTEQELFTAMEPKLKHFLAGLPVTSSASSHASTWELPPLGEGEALTIPAPVNYVGKGAKAPKNLPCSLGALMVVTRYLRTAWLWDQIRVKGGAYGAFCIFDALSRGLTMVSYRDPHIVKTLGAFDATADYLRASPIGEDELNKAVVGAIGDLDAHLLPDAKGHVSLRRFLTNQDDAFRQRVREEILDCSAADFRAVADVLDAFSEQGRVVILGGETALNEAAASQTGRNLLQGMRTTSVL